MGNWGYNPYKPISGVITLPIAVRGHSEPTTVRWRTAVFFFPRKYEVENSQKYILLYIYSTSLFEMVEGYRMNRRVFLKKDNFFLCPEIKRPN